MGLTGGTLKYALIYTSSAIVNTQHVPVHHQRWSQCVWNKPHLKHNSSVRWSKAAEKSSVTHLVVQKCKKHRMFHKNDLVNSWQYITGSFFMRHPVHCKLNSSVFTAVEVYSNSTCLLHVRKTNWLWLSDWSLMQARCGFISCCWKSALRCST